MAHEHAAHGGQAHGGHGHAPARYDAAFAIGIGLNLVYVAAEVVFGLLAGSMALVADAGHNLGDVLGLALAWGAVWLGRRRPTPRRTYGFKRSTILASLANAVILLVSLGAILVEFDPAPDRARAGRGGHRRLGRGHRRRRQSRHGPPFHEG